MVVRAFLTLIVIFSFGISLHSEEPKSAKINISRETTYAIGPFLPDGRIDYYASLNGILAEGITKENNIVVGIFTYVPGEKENIIMRYKDDPEQGKHVDSEQKFRKHYWKLLGFESPPPLKKLAPPYPFFRNEEEAKNALLLVYSEAELNIRIKAQKESEREKYKKFLESGSITLETYDAEVEEIDNPPDWKIKYLYRNYADGEWEAARNNFWTEKDFPYLDKWNRSMDETAERLIEASKRPRYYSPTVGGEAMLFNVLLPYTQAVRNTGRLMQVRGNREFADGNYDRAMDCAMATIRIGHAMRTNSPFLVEELVGIALESMGNQQLGIYLSELDGIKDSQWLLARKKDYDEVYSKGITIPNPPRWILGERYNIISAIFHFAWSSEGFVKTLENTDMNDDSTLIELLKFMKSGKPLDWNLVLRNLNRYFDEIEDITTLPSMSRQLRACERFDRRMFEMSERLERSNEKEIEDNPESYFSEWITANLFPAITAAMHATCRIEFDRRATSLGFALAAYRADNGGKNPEKLDLLVPKYIDSVPNSPYTEIQMRYVLRENDCLITNDGHFKLDGNEQSLENAIAAAKSGERIFPEPRHYIIVVQKIKPARKVNE